MLCEKGDNGFWVQEEAAEETEEEHEDESDSDEETETQPQEEVKPKKKGFFSRLFGGKDK